MSALSALQGVCEVALRSGVRQWATLSVLLLVVASSIAGRAVNAEEATNASVRIEQKLGAQVPLDLEFTSDDGKPVKLRSLLTGRPVILNLVYFECPMLCNLSMQGLVTSLRGLSLDPSRDFTLITVSFDPHEGPTLAAAAKRTAVHRYGQPEAKDHWHFLTGDEAAIRTLADAVGFGYRYDEARGQYVHGAGLIVLTPEGRTSRYLLGVDYAPRDVQLALVEASSGEIGSVTDQVLLMCYEYDPLSGRYGLLIHRVLRLASIATVIALGSAVGGMLYYERAKARRKPAADAAPKE